MSRDMYVLGKCSIFPEAFAKTNSHHAPYVAIMVLGVVGVLMILFSATIMQYVNISGFYLLFVAFLVAVASLHIKKAFSEEYATSPFKLKGVWYYVWPGLTIVTGIAFMALQFVNDPVMTGVSVVLIPVGVAIYWLRKKRLEAKGVSVDELIHKEML